MKKITLLFLMLIAFTLSTAQETISFEAPAYSLGDINTQNGWITTPINSGGFIVNQVISDELATDGTNSLKIVQETDFGGQSGAIIGAFYNYAAPVAQEGSTFSADINITQQDANSSNFVFGLVNPTAQSFITWIEFDFRGNIFVLVDDGLGTVVRNDTGTAWNIDTWYNIKMEITGPIVAFFVDDTQVSSGTVIITDAVEQVRFSHDNFGGSAYIDNFKTNDENLSVKEFEQESITYFYDNNLKVLKLESLNVAFTDIQIYSILGQKAFSKKLSNTNETIDVSSLNTGVYLAKVNINGNFKTIKFAKN